MRKTGLLPILLASILLTSCGGGKRDDSVIRIGEYGSLTGSEATFGISTHEGILLAVDEVNRAGGVNGKPVTVITMDNQGKLEECAIAVTKLIKQDRVHAVLGEVASTRSLQGAPICQRNRVPMLSPSSTNPKVTEVGDYIFRACFIDPFQGKVMADFAAKDLKAKTAAILRDQNSDYSIGLSDVFTARFRELGGTIVADESYVSGKVDFKSQLTVIREKRPDCVYVPGYYTEVGLILRQARELGMNQPFMGGDGWDSPELFKIAGKAAENGYQSNHYTPESKDPKVVEFVAKYRARWGKTPDALATLGYDAALILCDAMRRARSLDGPDIRDALAATKDFPGVTGKISMDARRNAEKSAVVLKISGGRASYLTTVNP
jgi:branched-chain amino acid transport system substrate-binding protein